MKEDLLEAQRLSDSGLHAVHLASFVGNLEIIEALHNKFDVDFNKKTLHGLNGLHFAAQNRDGIVTIYYLKENFPNFDPNITDNFRATALHYAIFSCEENNIQALLSLGSGINSQDALGNSSLH